MPVPDIIAKKRKQIERKLYQQPPLTIAINPRKIYESDLMFGGLSSSYGRRKILTFIEVLCIKNKLGDKRFGNRIYSPIFSN